MLVDMHDRVSALADSFSDCTKILTAIGDETRLHLILEMMRYGNCNGVRFCEITESTNLSRPAVSQHLQILKNAGIVKVRKEGTKNHYYFDPETESFEKLGETFLLAQDILKSLPNRSGD